MVNKYAQSHERYTWRGVLHTHAEPKKRKGFKILSHPRDRAKDKTLHVPGSCVCYSFATALEAAFRACGVDVDKLSWEDLHDMIGQDNPFRARAALRALKYHGIRREADYKKGNTNGKRFKIAQFCDISNGLNCHNIEGAINNYLRKTVMVATFPISYNYYDMENGAENIYEFDEDDPVFAGEVGPEQICTHMAVITGFGFEEEVPYFEFLDCNGKTFGKNGFGRILPSSILSLYTFDVIVD
ncbi:unnamed protein product [Urochloa humidicola]